MLAYIISAETSAYELTSDSDCHDRGRRAVQSAQRQPAEWLHQSSSHNLCQYTFRSASTFACADAIKVSQAMVLDSREQA